MRKAKKLTKVVVANILKQLSEGVSLRKACESHKVSSGSFCDLMIKDAELAEQYVRAREAGADVQFDLMDDLEVQVLNGELDPQAFRVAMDARKWRLGRMSPKKYGEKIEISGGLDLAVAIQEGRKRAAGQ